MYNLIFNTFNIELTMQFHKNILSYVLNVVRKNKWGILSERYAVPILISLLDSENPKLSDLTPRLGSYNTIENLIFDMEKSGLLVLNRVTRPYKTTYILLTDHGKEVAKALSIADKIVNGQYASLQEVVDSQEIRNM